MISLLFLILVTAAIDGLKKGESSAKLALTTGLLATIPFIGFGLERVGRYQILVRND